MDRLQFKVRGSQPEPYDVAFSKDGNNLTALCTCRAGQIRTYCKHRLSLLCGDITDLASDNAHDVRLLKEWLMGSDVEYALAMVDAYEKELEAAKKKLNGYKKALARTLHD